MRTKTGQQGEVAIFKIDALPEMQSKEVAKTQSGDFIISHSESGAHHVVPGDCTVMERTDNVPPGMRILYAILDNPGSLSQSAANAHGAIALDPGIYEFRISREYDPFAEQARMVAD